MEKSTKKLCIYCKENCEIFPIMLGDSFTLTYLRVCNTDCLFWVTYDYLYSICHHKDFQNHLHESQEAEDKKKCDEFIRLITDQFLDDFKKHLEANPKLLSTPTPPEFFKMFSEAPSFPMCNSTPMKFYRPTKKERLKWAKENVVRTCEAWEQALKELDKLERE